MTEPGSPRSIPEEYAVKMKAARATDSMHGERRLVSILFCDVTGSTAMAKELDPERAVLAGLEKEALAS